MTHITYSQQQLHLKSLAQLKRTYSEIGCTIEVRDRRRRNAWISAIASHQAAQLQKIARLAKDEQAIAQGEFEQYIEEQAEAVAPEPLTTVEINFYHHEVYCGKELIAYITYDHSEFVTQPWLVMVNGKELFRDTTVTKCQRFIEWHHKDGTLNLFALTEVPEVPTISEISCYDQEAFADGQLVASISYDHENYQDLYWRVLVNDVEIFRDTTPARCHSYIKQQYQQGTLPVQKPFSEPCTIGNEVMLRIFNEYEKCGLELLEDGIYHNNVKLGQVGCTDGNWWVILGSCGQQQYSDSVFDAVGSLLEGDVVGDAKVADCEQLLDLPFEELTAEDWQRLRAYKPVPGLVAA
ncbi:MULTISPECIES: hypothetical protein [Nostoc]|uniref:Uncharacterized protein n=1 Tax=Nostoc paludosum FACHB-159 TaxID=2692908 RepID=A0ABR8KM84_9NOSO|nr:MULTISPECIES: hypothetical protein [Nostoc]MBD2683521.1 hypothetical protein [Nostoc sp. FACHB-857]MBD2739844.1 hypothetical protein [Nostoc paludosum FACHB-159]